MKKEELNNEYGLYKSLDLEKDERINIFCKAGGGLIYFSLIVIGYFLSNQTLLFKVQDNPLLWLQLILMVVVFIAYNYLHELVHLIAAKIKKINGKWNRDGISSYLSLEGQLINNKTYYFIVFAPVIVFTIILIPLQIIVALFAFDWFWLVWLVIIQNYASSIGDIVAFLLTKRFKNSYLEDADSKILIYVKKAEFKMYHEIEKAIFDKKALKASKKKNRKTKLKRMKEAAKAKSDADFNNYMNKRNNDQDINDLSKLDM